MPVGTFVPAGKQLNSNIAEFGGKTMKSILGRIGRGIRRVTKWKEFGILSALLILCVAMIIASPYFLTTNNIFNVFRQFSIYAILAVGEAMVIIVGGLDLSIGTVMGLMGVFCALFSTTFGLPPDSGVPACPYIRGNVWYY